MNSTLSEELMYSTVRLVCKDRMGKMSYGTGFIFGFLEGMKEGLHSPFIVTNKHVVLNAISAELIFTKKDDSGKPLDTEHQKITIDNLQNEIIDHPDVEVDLCAISLVQIYLKDNEISEKIYISSIPKFIIPKENEIQLLNAIEDIIMIGYPIALWDDHNNKPIFRKGITASHPKLDYRGKKEILIDAACYPGSSGSPVFIINEGYYSNKEHPIVVGRRRVYLLGILHSGPTHNLNGTHSPANVVNLGNIIKAERLFELEEQIKIKFQLTNYY